MIKAIKVLTCNALSRACKGQYLGIGTVLHVYNRANAYLGSVHSTAYTVDCLHSN